jgi:large subunit ribosomal protein L29
MASTKTLKGLRDKSVEELRARERDLREQLFKLRFQRATGRMENPMKMRQVRREIAQIETLLGEQARTGAERQ